MEPTNMPPKPGIKPDATSNDPTKSSPMGSTKTIGSDAKDLATKVAGQAKGAVADQLTEQQEKSADKLGQVADALRRTSEDLSDSMAAPYVEKAAAMVDRFAGSVRNASVSSVKRSTESFARREPLLFLGGAFALGLLAARFLKSSEHHDDDDKGQRLLTDGRAPTKPYGTQRAYAAYSGTGVGGVRGRDDSH